jgi:hypothetical protein
MQMAYGKSAKEYYSDPLLRNLLDASFRKYKRSGTKGKYIKLYVRTKEEAQRLQDFFGSVYLNVIKVDKEIKIEMSVIEHELKKKYSLTLQELYKLLHHKQLLTHEEQKQIKEKRWEDLFTEVKVSLQRDESINLENEEFWYKTYDWFYRVKKRETQKGYMVLKVALNKEKDAVKQLRACMKSLWAILMDWDNLMKESAISTDAISIPFLATKRVGDAHALDKNEIAGRLFFTILEYIYEYKVINQKISDQDNQPEYKFMKVRHIYRHFKILDDDISSFFHIFSPYLYDSEQKLTKNLSNSEKEVNLKIKSNLYVFENPSIFNYLVDELEYYFKTNDMMYEMFSEKFPILICTSGQARDAVLLFITKCLNSNQETKVYYAGDFDGAGIQMYRNMLKRFPGKVQDMKMDEKTYLSGINKDNMTLTTGDNAKISSKQDDFVKFMKGNGVIVFQEGVTDILRSELFIEIERVLKIIS